MIFDNRGFAVVVCLDDILITGKYEQEHLSDLGKMLTNLEETGLWLMGTYH